MIQVALASQPQRFPNQHGVWYVDNIAVRMALVRGRSDNSKLDAVAMQIQCVLVGLIFFIYFDWIQSYSNWADGISRVGLADDYSDMLLQEGKQNAFGPVAAAGPSCVGQNNVPGFL